MLTQWLLCPIDTGARGGKREPVCDSWRVGRAVRTVEKEKNLAEESATVPTLGRIFDK